MQFPQRTPSTAILWDFATLLVREFSEHSNLLVTDSGLEIEGAELNVGDGKT